MAASYADELRGFPRKSVNKDERHPWPFLRIEQPLYTRGDSREVQERVERMLAGHRAEPGAGPVPGQGGDGDSQVA